MFSYSEKQLMSYVHYAPILTFDEKSELEFSKV